MRGSCVRRTAQEERGRQDSRYQGPIELGPGSGRNRQGSATRTRGGPDTSYPSLEQSAGWFPGSWEAPRLVSNQRRRVALAALCLVEHESENVDDAVSSAKGETLCALANRAGRSF